MFMTTFAISIIAVSVMILTFIATLRLVTDAGYRGPLAHANDRSMHTGSVPTSGGIAVVASTLVGWLAHAGLDPSIAPIILGALMLMGISWLDDAVEVSAGWRLAAQFLAATLTVSAIQTTAGPVFGGQLPMFADAVLAIVALVWFVNLFNFMDGIDGIAGAEGIAVLTGACLVHAVAFGPATDGAMPVLAILLAAGFAGFLFWNWHPARIFLGDAGAVPAGLLIAAVLFDLAARVSLAAAMILPLFFAADASFTLARRLAGGHRPWVPHRTHLYQRAALADGRHDLLVRRMSAVNVALIFLALAALAAPFAALGLAFALVAWFFRREEARIASRSNGRPRGVSGGAPAARSPDFGPSAPRALAGATKCAGR